MLAYDKCSLRILKHLKTNDMYIAVLITISLKYSSYSFLGTCRYIGPIEEKIISDEIFVGIELDDDLTKNSGVFGSRQVYSRIRKVKLTISRL